jgi:5'-methylthioadenosine phosphorylase
MENIEIGIIGGSGLYQMDELKEIKEIKIDTPFGSPSDAYITGTLSGRRVAFLARHSRGHRYLPSEINYRANIFGFKKLGVEWIISASAVGSMREDRKPMDIVIPDQFFDRTKARKSTFFGEGIALHISFADPVCPTLSQILFKAGQKIGSSIYQGGTYLCIEGPQFSTKAESQIYRTWGVDVIGMTNLTEAKLAREAEICYATLALITDYDVWHEAEEEVCVEVIVEILQKNAATAQSLIKEAITKIPQERNCPCSNACQAAVITDRKLIPKEVKKKLAPILGKYFN